MKIYNDYEERLYSTGDYELDMLLEKAFCEGYEYALEERVFNRRTSKLINKKLAEQIGKVEYKNKGITNSDSTFNLLEGRFQLKHRSPLSNEKNPRKKVINKIINDKAQHKAQVRLGEERPYTNDERKGLLKHYFNL